MGNYDLIQVPVSGQPISSAEYGIRVRDAIIDLDARVSPILAKPLVRLVQAAAQSIPDNTSTALMFGAGSEEIDTHGFHDTTTNNSRITPTIAGYYRFHGNYQSGTPTTLVVINVFFSKNGSAIPPTGRGNNGALTQSQSVTGIIFCNGTTDYVQLTALQDSAGAVNTNVITPFISVFECEFLRA